MRYIDEIRAFHEYLLNNDLSTGEIALWHALMGHNNRLGWIEEFSVSNLIAQQLTSLSRSGLDRARNSLKQKGLICYRAGKTGTAGHYQMVSVASIGGNIMDTPVDALHEPSNIMDMNRDGNATQTETVTRQISGTLTRLRLRLRQRSVNITATPDFEILPDDGVKRDLIAYVDSQIGDSGKALSGDLDYFLSKGMTGEEIQGAVDIAKSKDKPWRYAKGILTNQLNDKQGGKDHGTGKRDADTAPAIDERWSKGELY